MIILVEGEGVPEKMLAHIPGQQLHLLLTLPAFVLQLFVAAAVLRCVQRQRQRMRRLEVNRERGKVADDVTRTEGATAAFAKAP